MTISLFVTNSRFFFPVAVTVFLGLVMPASAQNIGTMTAISLRHMCASHYDVDAGMCAGYMMAVADKVMQDHNPARRACLSPAISPQVLVENVKREWESVAPAEYETAVENVERILRHRFRCP